MCVTSLCAPQLTSQDKTAQVVQRALEKHHLEHMSFQDFHLSQLISQDRGEAVRASTGLVGNYPIMEMIVGNLILNHCLILSYIQYYNLLKSNYNSKSHPTTTVLIGLLNQL